MLHVHDYQGLGYYTTVARSQGEPALQNLRVVVQGHGDSGLLALNRAAGEEVVLKEADMVVESMEVGSVEHADVFVSPSAWYMQHMVWTRGVTLPSISHVAANIVPPLDATAEAAVDDHATCTPRRSLAFYGRQTKLKGVELFAQAALSMCGTSTAAEDCPFEEVLFVGSSPASTAGHSMRQVVANTCAHLRVPCVTVPHTARQRAMALLHQRGALVVVPSLADIAPLVVVELAQHRVPFIASDAGGIPELLSASSRPRLFRAGDVAALAKAARAAAAQPCWVPLRVSTSHTYASAVGQWLDVQLAVRATYNHHATAGAVAAHTAPVVLPASTVTAVVLPASGEGELDESVARACLRSLRGNLEKVQAAGAAVRVVVVAPGASRGAGKSHVAAIVAAVFGGVLGDASTIGADVVVAGRDEATSALLQRVMANTVDATPGTAGGDNLVLVLHADDVLADDAVSTLCRALHTSGADAVSPLAAVNDGGVVPLRLGGHVMASLRRNMVGSSVLLAHTAPLLAAAQTVAALPAADVVQGSNGRAMAAAAQRWALYLALSRGSHGDGVAVELVPHVLARRVASSVPMVAAPAPDAATEYLRQRLLRSLVLPLLKSDRMLAALPSRASGRALRDAMTGLVSGSSSVEEAETLAATATGVGAGAGAGAMAATWQGMASMDAAPRRLVAGDDEWQEWAPWGRDLEAYGYGYGDGYGYGGEGEAEAPVPMLSSLVGSSTTTPSVSINATFTAAVTNVTAASFTITTSAGLSLGAVNVTGAGTSWVVTIPIVPPYTAGTVTVSMQDNAVGVSPPNAAALAAVTVTYAPPTVVLSSSVGPSGSAFSDRSDSRFTATFSSPVTGVTASTFGLVASSGIVVASQAVTGSGTTYVLTATIDGLVVGGSLTVSIPAAPTDVQPPSLASEPFTLVYDPPFPTITCNAGVSGVTTALTTLVFTANYSVPVTGVTVPSFALSTSGFAGVATVSGSGHVWVLTINIPVGVTSAVVFVQPPDRAAGVVPTPGGAPRLTVNYRPVEVVMSHSVLGRVLTITATFAEAVSGVSLASFGLSSHDLYVSSSLSPWSLVWLCSCVGVAHDSSRVVFISQSQHHDRTGAIHRRRHHSRCCHHHLPPPLRRYHPGRFPGRHGDASCCVSRSIHRRVHVHLSGGIGLCCWPRVRGGWFVAGYQCQRIPCGHGPWLCEVSLVGGVQSTGLDATVRSLDGCRGAVAWCAATRGVCLHVQRDGRRHYTVGDGGGGGAGAVAQRD